MAHGDYYNPANKSVTDGTVVYADDINKINTAIDSACDQIAYDLDVIEESLEAGGLSAKNWATEDQGTRPDPILDLYSARAYTLEAKDWASAAGTITEASTGAALAGSASAKTKAAEAAASALAASGSASSASGSSSIATTKAGEALGSANAAAISETNAGNSAIAAAASAANLPNATTAGANKLVTTNSSGSGFEYSSITAAGKAILDDASPAAPRATLGLGNVANVDTTNASNISSGTLADARIPSTITRDSEVSTLLAARSRKNLLINGGFDVWQRGVSYFSTAGYTADRWLFDIHHGTGGYILRDSFTRGQTTVPGGPLYYVNFMVDRTSGVSLSQRIPNFVQFMGKKLTCTFWAKLSTGLVDAYLDVQLNANYGTGGTPSSPTAPIASGTTGSFVPTTTWTKYTSTFDVPVVAPTWGTDVGSDYLVLQLTLLNMTGNPGLVHIANVQLEFGDTATDFEYRHPGEELALCRRYYETGSSNIPEIASLLLANMARTGAIRYKVTKRRKPSISVGALTTIGSDGTPGAFYTTYTNADEFCAEWSWTGGTAGRAFSTQFDWAADAEIY